MISGAWLEANTPTSLAIARPRSALRASADSGRESPSGRRGTRRRGEVSSEDRKRACSASNLSYRYFAMSAALLFRSPISGERHEPHWQGAFRRRAAVRLFFHDEELLHLR